LRSRTSVVERVAPAAVGVLRQRAVGVQAGERRRCCRGRSRPAVERFGRIGVGRIVSSTLPESVTPVSSVTVPPPSLLASGTSSTARTTTSSLASSRRCRSPSGARCRRTRSG
jgi:hypothetical protein